jgi:pentatricopeptide repeat protein
VSELVQNVRTILKTNTQVSSGFQGDWRSALSALKREATIPHQTVLSSNSADSDSDSNSSNDEHITVLPNRVYHEVLECIKKDKRSWRDAIRLVVYMEQGDEYAEAASSDDDDDGNKAIDMYNSRPWHIPSPNYEIYHTLIECLANNGGGRKDAHDASVYWLSKMLRKLEHDLQQIDEQQQQQQQTNSNDDGDDDGDCDDGGDDSSKKSSDAAVLVTISNRDRKLLRNSIQLVLASLSKERKWREALQLLEYMEILSRPEKVNLPLTVVQYNTVLTCLARSRQVGQCQRLLQRLQSRSKELAATATTTNNTINSNIILHPDAISYNAVIGACASAGRWKEALTVLDECYNEQGVEPNIYIYTNAMRACAKGGNTQKALSLLQVVKDKGLAVDSYCYTAVIDGT